MDADEISSLIFHALDWALSINFKTGGDSDDKDGDDDSGGGGSSGGVSGPASCESSNVVIN